MADYDRKLTHTATTTATTTDVVTLSGPDVTFPELSVNDAPYVTAQVGTGAAPVKGGRIYNGGSVDLRWSYGPTALLAADPSDYANEGVRRLPAGMTDEWDDTWSQVVVKVWSAEACSYSVEGN